MIICFIYITLIFAYCIWIFQVEFMDAGWIENREKSIVCEWIIVHLAIFVHYEIIFQVPAKKKD